MTVDMMKTLVLYPEKEQEQRVTIEERPVPVPELGEVLVRVHATTVCGRDKQLFSGGELGWRMEKNRKEYGAISGVEFSGVIATDGNDFAEGDAVYGCVDLSGTSFAHAEYVRVPEVTLVASLIRYRLKKQQRHRSVVWQQSVRYRKSLICNVGNGCS